MPYLNPSVDLLCSAGGGLLLWHAAAAAVVETTMVEPVRRGVLTPWHRTWHRAHPPSFSAAQLDFPINPFSLAYFASPLKFHFLLSVLLFFSSPSLPLSASCLFPESPLSISSFLLPYKDSHSPVALSGRTKSPEMPSQAGFLPWDSLPLSSPDLLCFLSTEGVTVFHHP